MQNYELLSVLPGTLTEEEAKNLAEQIKETVEKNGGKNIALEYNGKSRLAYPMKHIRYGYFFLSTFETTQTEVKIIQEKIRLVNGILRSICRIYNPSQKVGLILGENSVSQSDETMVTSSSNVSEPVPEVYEAPKVVVEAPVEAEVAPEETPAEEPKKADSKEDISMEEIDQKLDELLEKGM